MPARPARVRFIAMQLALAAAVAAALWLSFPAWRLGHIMDRVRREYPDVQWISTSDLANWTSSEKQVKPVILDARTPAEFQVSHLFQAHHVDPDGPLLEDDLPVDRGRAIVVYCATGERSPVCARRLQRAGFESVFALEGGIVRWANESRALTDGIGFVSRVHPGDAETAGLLKPAHRGNLPAVH